MSGLTLSGSASGNYKLASTDASGDVGTITKAALTVTAKADSKTYDGLAYSGGNGVTYAGFVNGETSSVLGGTLDYTGTSQGAVDAGSYVITPEGYTSDNYAIAYDNGALTVDPRTLTASLQGTVAKVYDGTTAATLAGSNYDLDGIVGTDDVGISTTSGLYDTADAGTGKTVSVTGLTLSGSASDNYKLASTDVSGNVGLITKAALTVTAKADSKTYDGLAYSGGNGVTYAGFVNGETASVLGGTLGYTGTSQGAVNAGSYVITPEGYTSDNYGIAYDNGTLTVNKATLTASLQGTVEKVYDGTTAATLAGSNYDLAGIVGTDDVVLNDPTSGLYDTANAGTGKTVSVTGLALSGTAAGNYQLSGTDVSGNVGLITKAALTVTAKADSKTYDGLAYSGGNGVTYAGFVNGETASVLGGTLGYTGTSQGAVNAGSYVITPEGYTSDNYGIAYDNGTLTVNKAILTASLAGTVEKVYDGTTAATLAGSNYDLAGIVGTDDVGISTTSGLYDTADAGTGKTVSVTGLTLSGSASDNYQLASTDVSGDVGTITAKMLTALLQGTVEKVYDGNTTATLAGSNYDLAGIVGTDDVELNDPTSGSYDTANAGTGKTVSVTGLALSGSAAGNYQLSGTDVSGNVGLITKAALTVTAKADSKTYDGLAYSGGNGVTYSGFVNGETASVLDGTLGYAGTSQGAVNAGSYVITPEGLTSGNYAIAYGNGALTVDPRAITVTADDQARDVGAANPALTYSVTAGSLVAGDAFTGTLVTTADAGSPAGTYPIDQGSLALSANYSLGFVPGTLTVIESDPDLEPMFQSGNPLIWDPLLPPFDVRNYQLYGAILIDKPMDTIVVEGPSSFVFTYSGRQNCGLAPGGQIVCWGG